MKDTLQIAKVYFPTRLDKLMYDLTRHACIYPHSFEEIPNAKFVTYRFKNMFEK